MRVRRFGRVILALGVCMVGSLPGISNAQQRRYTDPSVRLLTYERLTVLVFPERDAGVYVWAAWRSMNDEDDQFVGRYDPSDLTEWMVHARGVIDAPDPDRSDTSRFLATPPVADIDDGHMFIGRRRGRRGWERQRVVALNGRAGTQPMVVDFLRPQAVAFLDALAESVGGVDWPDNFREGLIHTNPADPISEPRPDPDNPSVHYPQALLRTRTEGDVWMTFVLDESGAPEMDTVRILMSDHPLFQERVIEALAGSRFSPASRDGRPVRVQMFAIQGFRIG